MVPATNSISHCLGVNAIRSEPNRAKSYVEPMVAINSIPQQDVANGRGHRELALAKPIALSNIVVIKPSPQYPSGISANLTLLFWLYCTGLTLIIFFFPKLSPGGPVTSSY